MTTATLDRPAALTAAGPLVVAYCRISSDRAGAGLGVAAQEAAIRARFPAVDVVLTDNDVSAYSGKPRPGYAELLDLVADGRVTEILVWHTDRLHRSNLELEGFIALVHARGVSVQSVTAGPLDLSTPAGQLNARIAGAIAQHESAHKSERLTLMHARKAAAGQFHGGRRRFGYNANMSELDTAEAAAIVEAAERVLAGESLLSITRLWNKAGLLTPTGKPWRSPNVGKLLRSPHLAAIRMHNGAAVVATWPAVFDADTHESLVAFLTNPDRVTQRFTGVRKHWLSGQLECAVCGGPMYGRKTPLKSGPAYICRENHSQAPTARVDATVHALVIERLASVDMSGAWLAPVDVERANARAAERLTLAETRRNMPALLAGGMSPDDYAAGLAAVDARVSELDAEATNDDTAGRLPARVLDGLTGVPVDVVAERFAALPWDRQRAVVAVLGVPVLARASRKGVGLPWERARVTMRWAT